MLQTVTSYKLPTKIIESLKNGDITTVVMPGQYCD